MIKLNMTEEFHTNNSVLKLFSDAVSELHEPNNTRHIDPFSISNVLFSLPDAKKLIMQALKGFDPKLASCADDILFDDSRLNIHNVEIGQGGMMRCRAAGLKMDANDDMRLENAGLSEEFVSSLRERYKFDDNEHGEKAVIDFDYNSTIGSVIYLAHELGHAAADDYQRNNNYSYTTNPSHMAEVQAYFVQNLILEHLRRSPNKEIAAEVELFFQADFKNTVFDESINLKSRSFAIMAGRVLALKSLEMPKDKRASLVNKILGGDGPIEISEIARISEINEKNANQALENIAIPN